MCIVIKAAILLIVENQLTGSILRVFAVNVGTGGPPVAVPYRSLILKGTVADYVPGEVWTAALLVLLLLAVYKFSISLHGCSIKYLRHHDIITFSPGRHDLRSLHLLLIFLLSLVLSCCNRCLVAAILQLNVLKLHWRGWCFCLIVCWILFKVERSLVFSAGYVSGGAGLSVRTAGLFLLTGKILDQLRRRGIRDTYSAKLNCRTLRV